MSRTGARSRLGACGQRDAPSVGSRCGSCKRKFHLPAPLHLVEFLYRALRSSFGIVIRCEDRDFVRQKLYEARRDSNDPDLSSLSFLFSPTDPTDLWIVHSKSAPHDPS